MLFAFEGIFTRNVRPRDRRLDNRMRSARSHGSVSCVLTLRHCYLRFVWNGRRDWLAMRRLTLLAGHIARITRFTRPSTARKVRPLVASAASAVASLVCTFGVYIQNFHPRSRLWTVRKYEYPVSIYSSLTFASSLFRITERRQKPKQKEKSWHWNDSGMIIKNRSSITLLWLWLFWLFWCYRDRLFCLGTEQNLSFCKCAQIVKSAKSTYCILLVWKNQQELMIDLIILVEI